MSTRQHATPELLPWLLNTAEGRIGCGGGYAHQLVPLDIAF